MFFVLRLPRRNCAWEWLVEGSTILPASNLVIFQILEPALTLDIIVGWERQALPYSCFSCHWNPSNFHPKKNRPRSLGPVVNHQHFCICDLLRRFHALQPVPAILNKEKHCIPRCGSIKLQSENEPAPFINIFANQPWLESDIDMNFAPISTEQDARATWAAQPAILKVLILAKKFSTQRREIVLYCFLKQSFYNV